MKGLWKKSRWVILAGALMAAMGSLTAYAATVSDIRLTFTDTYDDADGNVLEPVVSVSGYGHYDLGEVSWSKDMEDWTPGKKVTAAVTLYAGEGYTFDDSYTKSECRVYGADYQSAKSTDGTTLKVKAAYVPVVKLGQSERAGWSDTTRTKASWKKVRFATAYQIRLYRDGSSIKTLTVETNNVDLSSYMREEASYYYEVRATYKNSSESKYLKTGDFVTSEDVILDNLGDTNGVWRNYPSGSKYLDEDGNYVTNGWKLILGKWYYFDNEGYAVRGWKDLNGKWYYLGADGAMQTGWVQAGGRWFYLKASGEMATGWVQSQPGFWYYLDSSGVMQTGWINVGGQWYYLDSTGLMASNTVVDGYQLGADGARITG